MEGSKVGLSILRVFQLIFAVTVLGISADLASTVNDTEDACKNYTYIDCDYYLGRLPESSDYAAFTGAFGLVAAAVGLVGAVVSAIPWFVALIFDVLAAIFYLAGGINMAVLRGSGECNASFCREWTASTAFMFIAFVATVASIPIVIKLRRSN